MRRFLILMSAVLMAVGLAACGSSSKKSESSTTTAASSNTSTPTTIKTVPVDCGGTPAAATEVTQASDFKPVKAGTLSVVTSLPGPGFWNGSDNDPTKLTSGYEYDIAQQLQKAFNLPKIDVRNVSFDAITAGQVKDYDIALSQVTITCDRAKVVKFSQPYFYSYQSALVKKGFNKPLSTIADAQKLKWGVQTTTTAVALLQSINPTTKPLSYGQLGDGYTALEAGQIDAFMIDTTINLDEAAKSKGTFEVPVEFQPASGPDQYGAILPNDSTNAGAVNAAIKQLKDSGQLAQFAQKNLSIDPNLPVIAVP